MATDKAAGSVVACPKCNAETTVPITVRRANEIVDRLSQLFMNGGLWDYTPLSAIGASSRLEALHALYVATAQTFQMAFVERLPSKQKILNDFLRGAGGVQIQMVSFLLPDSELTVFSTLPDPTANRMDWNSASREELREFSQQLNVRNAESERLQRLAQSDAVFNQSEAIDSFVSFLRALDPSAENYWPYVYRRIGLPCPFRDDADRPM